jgi:hypothetical protein
VGQTTSGYLVVDIETVPDGSLWSPPGVAAAEPALAGVARSSVHERAFPPTYAHRIIVVGCLWLDRGYGFRGLWVLGGPTAAGPTCAGSAGAGSAGAGSAGAGPMTEGALLREFSRFVDQERPALVTYNGRAFDLPVIALRSLRHGVAMPWYYERSPQYERGEGPGTGFNPPGGLPAAGPAAHCQIDLCEWLASQGGGRAGSLDAMARLIGLPGKLGIDGSKIDSLHRAGELETIANYCLTDVAQTALLFLRFRLLQGAIDVDHYRSAVLRLTEALRADTRLKALMDVVDRSSLLCAA